MIDKNKFIYLRYQYQQVVQPVPNPGQPPVAPTSPTGNPNSPGFLAQQQQYGSDLHNYDIQNQIYQKNLIAYQNSTQVATIQTVQDDPTMALKLFAHKIDYGISIGTATITGLQQADLRSWYMKPATIKIIGESLASSNLMLDSDNMVINIFTKLQERLSEENFNYYEKPQIIIYIENGVQNLDAYVGVCKNFNFSETADYPDKYDFNMDFECKPYTMDILARVEQAFANDITATTSQINQLSATALLNQTKFVV